jgi:hypothetical protein
MRTAQPDEYGGPWYVHFWPWFIVILLGTAVSASLATVFIAVRGADALVADDYYTAGKAINRTLAADREASLREARAEVSIEKEIAVALAILGELPGALELELSHVTHPDLDRKVLLERATDGSYVAVRTLPGGNFYATLRPAGANPPWRLQRRIVLPDERSFAMEPSG